MVQAVARRRTERNGSALGRLRRRLDGLRPRDSRGPRPKPVAPERSAGAGSARSRDFGGSGSAKTSGFTGRGGEKTCPARSRPRARSCRRRSDCPPTSSATSMIEARASSVERSPAAMSSETSPFISACSRAAGALTKRMPRSNSAAGSKPQIGDLVEREAHAIGRHRAEQAEACGIERAEDALRHLDDEAGSACSRYLSRMRGQRRQRPDRAPGGAAEIAGDEEWRVALLPALLLRARPLAVPGAGLGGEMAGDGQGARQHQRIQRRAKAALLDDARNSLGHQQRVLVEPQPDQRLVAAGAALRQLHDRLEMDLDLAIRQRRR